MNPVRTQKISLLTHTADPQKDSRTNSDLESLLVSSVRYDPTIYYTSETQGQSRQHPSRATHHIRSSLIKKNSMSNIVVEEVQRCACEQKLECITNSIQILSLTLQELESKISLCFTKQASLQAEVCSYRCQQQSIQQENWQWALREQEKAKRSAHAQEEMRLRLKKIDDEVGKIKMTMSRFESKDNQKCLASKLLQHRFQKYKGQQENRVQSLLQSIDEIAHIQRKIMNGCQKQSPTFPDEQSSLISYPAHHSRKVRVLRGCSFGRNQTCESTNISYSRNTDK